MSTIKELQEKRVGLYNEVRAILDNKEATADDKKKADGLLLEMNTLAADIERIQKADAVDAEMRKINFKPENDPNGKNGKDGDGKVTRTAAEQDQFELNAFYKFCMRGRQYMTAEENAVIKSNPEARTVEGLANGVGGELVPPAFQRQLEQIMKFYAPFTEWAQVFETQDGAPMIWPVSDSTGRFAQIVPEGSAVTDADVATSKVLFGAYKYGDLVKVGMEISQDSFTSVDGLVTDAFAQSFGRKLSLDFTTGSGTGQPTGILTAATNSNVTAVGDLNATSPNPNTAVGYTDFLALLHSVDPAYRNAPGAKFMFSDSTLLAGQSLQDKYGRPLWQPSFTSVAPDLILGKPYIINNSMASIGESGSPLAENIPVLFGDLSKYKVRKVKGMSIQKLTERYAEYGQVGFIAWARYDGNLLVPTAVKYLAS
jgi:HK97 family phage major capsid protein